MAEKKKQQDRKMLDASEILAADDLPVMEVDVPEWGGTIRLRALSAAQTLEFIDSVQPKTVDGKEVADRTSNARLVLLSVVDEHGDRAFTDDQMDRLQQKSMGVITRIALEALKLNGLGEQAADLAKNVSGGPVAASPTVSR